MKFFYVKVKVIFSLFLLKLLKNWIYHWCAPAHNSRSWPQRTHQPLVWSPQWFA